MSPRTQQRAPKGRDRDRADRRAVVDVLLARLHRGALSPAEAALLAEHMREEQRVADESRQAMAGTTQALERHRAAAAEAIVEAEERATQAEARTEEVQRAADEQRAAVARVRVLARTMRAGSPMGAAAIYADRIEQALDNDRRALDPDTAIRAQFLDAAESATARLAEQQRDHDIALATARQDAQRHRDDYLAACRTIADVHQAATGRTGLAPIRGVVEDVAAVRARAQATEQQLDAVRAALPTEPRPRLGVPTDLAYANGRHDLAAHIEQALDASRPADSTEHQEHPAP
ncbi:hypothetical protein [Streptomyces sp. NPDC007094]|uniref:hypothetical protein n=1 Tax=Streptomyces sp. NPDC007094 TaxID=3155359 RepID=UPI0033F79390